MMDGSVEFKGKIFYIGRYRIGIWWTLLDISDGSTGRIYFFPWHPLRRSGLLKNKGPFTKFDLGENASKNYKENLFEE